MAAKIYLTTFSVRKIDWVYLIDHRHVLSSIRHSDGSKSRGEYIKIIRLLPKIEQSSANTLQRIVLQLKFVISNRMNEGNQCASLRLDARLENAYCKEMLSHSSRRRGPVEISELPQKHRGRSLLLGRQK